MSFSGTANTDFMKLGSIPNRKKVEYIDYAGTDFFSLRDNLISYIKAVYPEDYQNFSESDLGMMLIEVVSYMGSVLSLKGDMLANENYLRTVKNRNNLKKLLELVGVDMKGPLAAGAGARITNQTLPSDSNDFPVSIDAANRTIAITSKEDGAPVNYTIYKVKNNAINNIENANADLGFAQNEVANGGVGGLSSIFENAALLEGSLTIQKGTFDTLEGNKRVSLTNSPIVEGSVQVYVNTENEDSDANGAYTQVDRLYSASGGTDRIFQVIYDDDYAATVLFGDNSLGISPPAGAEFTVAYRVGGGSRGNLGQGTLNVETVARAGSTPVTLTVENRTPATGGSEAETAEHAKKYAPYTFKRQDRVVTLEDFIAIGNTFRSAQGTIGKTTAAVRDAFSSGNVIDVYTLEKADDLRLQKASPTFKKELLEEIEPKKMLTDEVVVVDGLIRTLDLVMTIRIDRELEPFQKQIEQEVAEVIRQHFNIDNADFGQPFVATELNREVFRLPNVRYATIDNLPEVIEVDFNEIIQLNNFTINTVLI